MTSAGVGLWPCCLWKACSQHLSSARRRTLLLAGGGSIGSRSACAWCSARDPLLARALSAVALRRGRSNDGVGEDQRSQAPGLFGQTRCAARDGCGSQLIPSLLGQRVARRARATSNKKPRSHVAGPQHRVFPLPPLFPAATATRRRAATCRTPLQAACPRRSTRSLTTTMTTAT